MYFYTPSALFTILIILASFACSFALPLTARSPTAVTVWDAPNLAGVSTNLPATATCEDLGEWENRIRSLMTEAGYRCDFYVHAGCVSEKDDGVLHYGYATARTLPGRFDAKIRSVLCQVY